MTASTIEHEGREVTLIRFADQVEMCVQNLHLFSLPADATEREIRFALTGFFAGFELAEDAAELVARETAQEDAR